MKVSPLALIDQDSSLFIKTGFTFPEYFAPLTLPSLMKIWVLWVGDKDEKETAAGWMLWSQCHSSSFRFGCGQMYLSLFRSVFPALC